METPGQAGCRLLAVLEDLASQESAAVLAADFESVAALQVRAAAVAEKLSSFAADPEVSVLRPRVEALVARRRDTQNLLATRLAAGRQEMLRLSGARHRLARLVPAYGAGAQGASQLNAAA